LLGKKSTTTAKHEDTGFTSMLVDILPTDSNHKLEMSTIAEYHVWESYDTSDYTSDEALPFEEFLAGQGLCYS
jgi:hypothetical protein